MNPKIKIAALDFVKSKFRPGYENNLKGQELHDEYSRECELFENHFKLMSKDEIQTYHDFVVWIDYSEMWKTDLTIDELWDIHNGI
jgi:hypothetical protein